MLRSSPRHAVLFRQGNQWDRWYLADERQAQTGAGQV
jgi:hypothetical protein